MYAGRPLHHGVVHTAWLIAVRIPHRAANRGKKLTENIGTKFTDCGIAEERDRGASGDGEK